MSGQPFEPPLGIPGAPPTQPVTYAPPAQRSSWPTVLGIIAIVLGALGILGGLWGLISPMVMKAAWANAPAPNQAMLDAIEPWRGWVVLCALVTIVLAIALLVSGIGLVRRRTWARPLCQTWAVFKILYVLASSGLGYQMARASYDTASQQSPNLPALGPTFAQSMAAVGVCVGIVWSCALPVFLLIWLSRARIKAEIAEWW